MSDVNPADPVEAAVSALRRKREELAYEAEQLDRAIEALELVVGRKRPGADYQGASIRRSSVRTMAIALMDEADQDWSTSEILAEYQRRGTPVHGKDPSNALRAALADAKKRGMIVNTRPGRYKSARWASAQRTGLGGLSALLDGPVEREVAGT